MPGVHPSVQPADIPGKTCNSLGPLGESGAKKTSGPPSGGSSPTPGGLVATSREPTAGRVAQLSVIPVPPNIGDPARSLWRSQRCILPGVGAGGLLPGPTQGRVLSLLLDEIYISLQLCLCIFHGRCFAAWELVGAFPAIDVPSLGSASGVCPSSPLPGDLASSICGAGG